MKLHLIALPHVRLGTQWTKSCAYSGKVVNFCKMMKDDYEILVYAPESDPVEGATLIPCSTDIERQAIYGKDDPNRLPDWPTAQQFAPFNLKVIEELRPRLEKDDIILLAGGYSHYPIALAFRDSFLCEPFIGMEGIIFQNVWGAYESNSHMAAMYQKHGVQDIRCFDTVINPFYDPDDFPELSKGGDYLLFLGRLVFRKGPHIAAQIADACGMPLVVAGAGAHFWSKTKITAPEVTIEGKELIYVGPQNPVNRAKIISNAAAMLVPTTYREPGGNVAIEAMACGTPAVCSNFGVFAETVPSQFLFRTLKEAVEAVEEAKRVNRKRLRQYADEKFSLKAIAPRFKHWFEIILSLRRKGWYDLE